MEVGVQRIVPCGSELLHDAIVLPGDASSLGGSQGESCGDLLNAIAAVRASDGGCCLCLKVESKRIKRRSCPFFTVIHTQFGTLDVKRCYVQLRDSSRVV